jgi:predicted short-subunit dehydrogenase-like oxidoreductase (DUF2520 family)
MVIVAVRDPDVTRIAERLARGLVRKDAVVLHVSGALGPDALAPLSGRAAGLGVAHPLASFASASHPPRLAGALLRVTGNAAARRAGRSLAAALGMRARTWNLDPVLYHAAAVVLANGAAALAAAAQELLVKAGVPRREAASVLAPLLASVADNVALLGLPEALTGPVRRGDAATVERHLERIRVCAPEIGELYRASARAQVPMATALGDAEPHGLRRIERLVRGVWKR